MVNPVISIILMVIGLIGLLAGYKIFKLFLALSAFIFAFNLAFNLLPEMDYTVRIVICIVTGAAAGVFSFFVYRIGIFLMWTALAMELARLGIESFKLDLGTYREIGIIVIGVIIGVSALVFQIEKFAIIIATTLGGSAYFIMGLMPFLNKDVVFDSFLNVFSNLSQILEQDKVLTVVFIVLVLIGVGVQLQTNLGKGKDTRDDFLMS